MRTTDESNRRVAAMLRALILQQVYFYPKGNANKERRISLGSCEFYSIGPDAAVVLKGLLRGRIASVTQHTACNLHLYE